MGDDGMARLAGRLNWLRAGVLGANDGVVSTAGTVIGVAGATNERTAIAVAGVATLVAGAFSMAGGEFASVSAQRDTEEEVVATEGRLLSTDPGAAERELAQAYVDKGLSEGTARLVASELSASDALEAHAQAEYGLDPHALVNPWAAALSSFVAFSVGALLPLLTILFLPPPVRVWGCAVAVAAGLLATGYSSSRLGGAPPRKPVLRNVSVGLLTMAVTYGVGSLFGIAIG